MVNYSNCSIISCPTASKTLSLSLSLSLCNVYCILYLIKAPYSSDMFGMVYKLTCVEYKKKVLTAVEV